MLARVELRAGSWAIRFAQMTSCQLQTELDALRAGVAVLVGARSDADKKLAAALEAGAADEHAARDATEQV